MTPTSANSLSPRLTLAIYGLLAALSVASIVVLRERLADHAAEPPRSAPVAAVATTPKTVAPQARLRAPAQAASAVVEAPVAAVSFPSERSAQLLAPILAPPEPVVAEAPSPVPQVAQAAAVVAAPPYIHVTQNMQPSTVPDVSPWQPNLIQAPVDPPPPAFADVPLPYQIGSFTQYGTITPADVRAMALANNKEIAVVGRIPQVNGPLIGVEEAVFDPVFNVALNGGRYNRQTSTQIQALGVGVPVLKTQFWQPINGLNQVYLEKQFVTGGKVQAGFGQTYFNYSPEGDFVFVNPAYQASFNVLMEQPLFRGRGPAWTTAPLQIAQANHDQSIHTFRATVNLVLRDAENAYWETYAAYQDFEVRDLSYRQALETLDRERGRLELGEGSVPDTAQAEEQAEAFHIARTEAENRLVEAQRRLRRIIGLPPGDPRPIIPAVAPSEAPVNFDWDHAAASARHRPEVAAQAAALQAVEIELARRRNGLQPDLSVLAIYSATGLDNNFDQAWGTAGTFAHNSWTAGFVYKQPLGRRADRSLADRAAAAVALESARLRQIEHDILHQLDAAFQNVKNAQRMMDLHRRRREAAAVQLTARRELYLENRALLRDQLDAEVRYASAMYDESLARVNYQKALTDWNFARGAMTDGEVVVAE